MAVALTCSMSWAAEDDVPKKFVNDGAWRIEASAYTHHFSYNEDHKYVWAIGLEREAKDQSLYGLTVFSNSFGQPSAYAYYGRVYRNLWGLSESLYFKLTGGLLYGYKEPYEHKVPFNYHGFSPAIIPGFGWRLDQDWSVQMNFLGNAAVMLMVTRKL